MFGMGASCGEMSVRQLDAALNDAISPRQNICVRVRFIAACALREQDRARGPQSDPNDFGEAQEAESSRPFRRVRASRVPWFGPHGFHFAYGRYVACRVSAVCCAS
eukprot:4373175-Pleurochrysis_carterae.AAC.1